MRPRPKTTARALRGYFSPAAPNTPFPAATVFGPTGGDAGQPGPIPSQGQVAGEALSCTLRPGRGQKYLHESDHPHTGGQDLPEMAGWIATRLGDVPTGTHVKPQIRVYAGVAE